MQEELNQNVLRSPASHGESGLMPVWSPILRSTRRNLKILQLSLPIFTLSSRLLLHGIIKMAQRLTLRKRTPYNTKSNRRRVVKTPGGKLRYLHIKKLPTAPKCGDCHVALPGIKALRPREYATVSKTSKTVQRAYGGSRCANCVRTRIIRAFLVEEAKIVKQVMKAASAKK
ncbi:unnamed protein product [Sympodiomycopsis kandeliae]